MDLHFVKNFTVNVKNDTTKAENLHPIIRNLNEL